MTDYRNIPETTMDSLKRYVEHGLPPGHFLTAVLSNDLFGAMRLVDESNRQALFEICAWVYYEAPSICCGSPELVRNWIDLHAKHREKAEAKGATKT